MIGQWKAVVRAALVVVALGSAAALAEDGTRVEIRLPAGTAVEPDKLVQSLVTVGGERKEVRVRRQKSGDSDVLTIDLWGGAAPASEIPSLLREAFPQLAGATITVGVAPEAEKPQPRELDVLEGTTDGTQRKRVIFRKEIKE